MKPTSAWKEALLPGAVLAVILVIGLPLLNAGGYVSDYYLNLFGKYLSLAVLAMGMSLIWGFSGILSLGQAIFFGIGAYCFGMYLMLESSGKGVYGEAIPDFMVWNQVTQLPLYWKPFHSLPFAIIAALLVPAVAAVIIGFLTFRRRVGGTYFAILTQAMAFAAWLMFNRNEMNLGGTNGLTDFKTLLGYSLSEPATQRGLYLCTSILLVVSFFVCRWLVGSKMGLVLTAVRDQEQRLRFLGYPGRLVQDFHFRRRRGPGRPGGAPCTCRRSASSRPARSAFCRRWKSSSGLPPAGRNSLVGAIIGAVGINAARSVLTARFPEWWPDHPGQSVRRRRPVLPRWHRRHPRPVPPGPPAVTGAACRRAGPASRSGAAPQRGSRPQPRAGPTADRERHVEPQRGTIMYIEDITVTFDGFQAAERSRFLRGPRRIARPDRPQRRRQDDPARRHLRPGQAGHRARHLRSANRSQQTRGTRDHHAGHRAQVPDPHRVQEPDADRQSDPSPCATAAT